MKAITLLLLLTFSFSSWAQEGINFNEISQRKPLELKMKAQREGFVGFQFRAIADSSEYPIPCKLELLLGGDTVQMYRSIEDSLELELFSIKLRRGEQLGLKVYLYDISRKNVEIIRGAAYFNNKEEDPEFFELQAKHYFEWEDDFWRAGETVEFELDIKDDFKGANLVLGFKEDYVFEDLSLLLKIQKGKHDQLQRLNIKVQESQMDFRKKVIRLNIEELSQLPEGTYSLIIDQLETGFLLYGVDFIALEPRN